MPNDAEIWSNEIIKYMKNPEILKLMGTEAKSSIYKHWKDISLDYLQLYEQILKEKIGK